MNNSPKSKNEREDHKSIAAKAAKTPQRKPWVHISKGLEKVFFNDEPRVAIQHCRLDTAPECGAISWQRRQTPARISDLPKRLKSEMVADTSTRDCSDR